MNFLGYPIAEWSILVGLILTLGGLIIRHLGKRMKKFVSDILADFEKKTIYPLIKSINGLSNSFDKETTWVHDQHKEVIKQLEDHDKQLDNHDEKLTAHEERIKTLFRNQGRK
ncbi:hypothetical protein [Enterococcus pallens]|uniref:Uncharacterized protein n=1 Tax=Enterococcus pallens ATCC BAA-351 TaxID=1158607 RepID=R2SPY2_9ENTE|nr:hypothetical protein [Enterococcus pallens]EOH94856.1 hypothetical protein UAU_01778 [Enterococcus pallens ATCC BAA-351]EOU14825.1 hypothetical protein I588_04475 [Enterococcus pallens ATCC BAA-351]OJG71641.1 hypothetical protein RV10_GL004926 [Enterococcus pallens]